jgi:hypothetical protein
VTLFLWPMLLVIKSYFAFACTFALFLVGATGMFFFWWRPLMGRSENISTASTAPAPATSA